MQLALKGTSGVMVTLERQKEKKYICKTGTVVLESVAIAEKLIPADFINEEGNNVTEAFIEYCRPLIGKPIASFPSLASHKLNMNNSLKQSRVTSAKVS